MSTRRRMRICNISLLTLIVHAVISVCWLSLPHKMFMKAWMTDKNSCSLCKFCRKKIRSGINLLSPHHTMHCPANLHFRGGNKFMPKEVKSNWDQRMFINCIWAANNWNNAKILLINSKRKFHKARGNWSWN